MRVALKLLLVATWVGILVIAGIEAGVWAGEQLTLTKPITTPSTTGYTVERLTLNWPDATILLQFRGSNGEAASCAWSDATATTLMRQLNKLDLSVKSLQRRLLERAMADGCLGAGTVVGTPD